MIGPWTDGNPQGIALRETVLERVRVTGQAAIGASVAHGMNVEMWANPLADHLVFAVRTHVLAERLPPVRETATETVAVEVPATWWQAFKAEHGRRWWLRRHVRRHPVRHRTIERVVTLTVDLRRWQTYPRASFIADPRFGDAVPVHTIDLDVSVAERSPQ